VSSLLIVNIFLRGCLHSVAMQQASRIPSFLHLQMVVSIEKWGVYHFMSLFWMQTLTCWNLKDAA